MSEPTLKAEIRATGGEISFTCDREVTLSEIRAMIARAEAIGVPPEARITDFQLRVGYGFNGAADVRVNVRWNLPEART